MIRNSVEFDLSFNLLEADTFQSLAANPSLIRKSLKPDTKLIVIDEIQKLPILMDEVHLMIEEHGRRFLLTGSSARKLKRSHTSLMAGRAKFLRLFPFVTPEILISPGSRIDLDKILNFGMLPPVYLSEDPWEELKDYVSYYLREEILAESLTRNISAFSRFLLNAALSNAELLNYEQIGRDAQVSPRTVREHYVILEDTLIGKTLSPYKKAKSRKAR